MGDTQRVVSDALTLAGAGGRATSLSEAVKDAIPPVAPGFTDSVATIARQLEQLRGLAHKQAEAVAENTQVVAQNTAAQYSGGAASIAGSVARTAAKTLGGGLSLLPLVSSLAGLFSGGKSEAPPALPTYTAPPAVQFLGSAPQQGGQPIAAVDYGQDGRPRASSATPAYYAPAVTVQVQALDSRSFMDHSDDIARAVREALLNAHSLNDVMSEL